MPLLCKMASLAASLASNSFRKASISLKACSSYESKPEGGCSQLAVEEAAVDAEASSEEGAGTPSLDSVKGPNMLCTGVLEVTLASVTSAML